MLFLKKRIASKMSFLLIFRRVLSTWEFFNDCLECIHSVSLETIMGFGCLIRRALYHALKVSHFILTVTVSCNSYVLITCF